MKRLFTILAIFIGITSSAQHYFVVPTMNNALAKAQSVSRLFYNLSRPDRGTDSTEFLFQIIVHPTNDSVAIVLDTTYQIPKGPITAQVITNWITEVYGASLTTTQLNTVTNYINNNSILRISRCIVAAKFKLWTRAQMTARGWFNYTY